ncbi:MAG: HAMP domain-containing protein [Deltaproteobacteria bacterium]|nr:HAMP domain-containing protein [Deltaproteobacteria bacterium]
MSIRAKLVLAIVLTLGASGLASALLVRELYLRSARTAAEEALRTAAAAYDQLERNDVEKLATALDVAVHHPGLRDAFQARDRERLQSLTLPIHQMLKGEHGIGHWNYIEADSRKMFLRPHLPAKFGDVIERPSLLKAMSRLETSAGKELGKSEFALRVGRPFFGEGQKLIGYVELGEGITHFLGKMKAQTGNDFAMFIHKKLLDQSEWARTRGNERNNWNDFPDVVVVNSTTTDAIVDPAAIAANVGDGKVLEEQERGGATFARGVFPVRDSGGTVVGGLVVRHDISALFGGMRTGLVQALGFLVALALGAAGLVYLLVDRLIFRRLQRMMSTMEDLSVRLAGGDYTVTAGAPDSRNDEIGRFESFFGEFLGLVGNTMRGLAERNKQLAKPPPLRAPAPPAPPTR